MTTKKIPFNYDINRMLAVDLIAIIHIDDYDTRFLELTLFDDGTPFSVDGCTVTSRFVTISGSYLLSDNVPCEATGNTITIPIDAAAVQMMACDIKIEVNIVDGEKILTLPFPLWVRVRGSILETAHVTPESEGTIPELLKEAAEELERVQGFITEDDVYNILDQTLQGNPNIAPSLYVKPKGDNYALVYEDSDDLLHELFDFANLPSGGTSDYQELKNKPQINSHTLSGNKTSDELGLQKKLTAGTNISIGNDGTISASGGVTSYNDLTDKPTINNADIAGTYISDKLYIQDVGNAKRIFLENIKLEDLNQSDKNRIMTLILNNTQYDLNNILQTAQIIDINKPVSGYSNLPINNNGLLFCVNHYTQIYLTYRENLTDKTRIFVRQKTDYTSSWSLWQELTGGGSQIVSGVVNQDGTITFTDSDGNTFTTTGLSVIGADGFSPTATVTQTASGATVSITDSTGTTTANISNGADGQDYVLTQQDKTDIANIVLGELPTTQGVLYGNTSN